MCPVLHKPVLPPPTHPASLHRYSEDFAFLAARVPAAFAMLGIRNESVGSVHGLHSPHFRLDEAALPIGAALHVQFALDVLERGGLGSGGGGGQRDEL